MVFNFAAIVYGIAKHYTTGTHLTAFALWFNIFWAVLCLGLASLVVQFAVSRAKYKRQDYRFSLPIRAEMNLKSHGQIKNIQPKNISGAGLMFNIDKTVELKAGDEITGTLFLPAPLLYKAMVCSVRADMDVPAMIMVGCAFDWEDSRAMETLEAFLYGSDLEARMYNVTEYMPTLLQTIFSYRTPRERAIAAARMRTANVQNYRGY